MDWKVLSGLNLGHIIFNLLLLALKIYGIETSLYKIKAEVLTNELLLECNTKVITVVL